jgi:hypothetical protein
VASRGLHFSGAKAKVECRVLRTTNTLHGHHQSMLSFENAVQGGCFICSYTWNQLSETLWRTLYDVEVSWTREATVIETLRFVTRFHLRASDASFGLDVYLSESLESTSCLTSFTLCPKSSQCTMFVPAEM